MGRSGGNDGGVSYTANTIDAAANAIPLAGTARGLVETGVKAGIKQVVGMLCKDAAKELTRGCWQEGCRAIWRKWKCVLFAIGAHGRKHIAGNGRRRLCCHNKSGDKIGLASHGSKSSQTGCRNADGKQQYCQPHSAPVRQSSGCWFKMRNNDAAFDRVARIIGRARAKAELQRRGHHES